MVYSVEFSKFFHDYVFPNYDTHGVEGKLLNYLRQSTDLNGKIKKLYTLFSKIILGHYIHVNLILSIIYYSELI